MAQPYIGEIRMFAGNFAPAGWAFCNGQLLAISENDTLFTLIGTTYGGDGQSTFALPDMQSRIPVHHGSGNTGLSLILAETGGAENITLTVQQIPAHTHPMIASSGTGSSGFPQNNFLAKSTSGTPYNSNPNQAMNPVSITPTGGSQPHENMQPYLCISFIISLFGIFPSQT